jgi:hypothetical protein
MSITALPAERVVASAAELAVAGAAALVDPIGLDELMELAELQTRVDRKYFVPADVFRGVIAELAGELRVLDIDGKRRRTTFVSRTGEARLTCDSGLRCLDVHHEVRDTGTHVLVESKSGGQGGSAVDRILRELGVRPASVSKYCVAVAALHPELPSNPWHQTLKRYFEPLQTAAA